MVDMSSEPDIERLYGTTDASVWAEEFAKVCHDIDQGLMIGWFANAMATAENHLLQRTDNRHLIQFSDDGWTIQHPVRERITGSLFDCDVRGPEDDPGLRGVFEILEDVGYEAFEDGGKEIEGDV